MALAGIFQSFASSGIVMVAAKVVAVKRREMSMKDNFFIYLYELGCKGTKKNGDEQKNSVFSLQNTQQAPERRLVKVLCMRDLLDFHSHDIVGLAVTENVEVTIVEDFLCVSSRVLNVAYGIRSLFYWQYATKLFPLFCRFVQIN